MIRVRQGRRVLLVHNYYQEPGGEDQVYNLEAQLLAQHGFEVATFSVSNDELQGRPGWQLAAQTLWNSAAARRVARAAQQHQAEIVHFHNTFPLLSPAVYGAARQAGAATVQTLHNYRLLCANATLFRDGGVCEECVGRLLPAPAVLHRCYRTRGASAVVAALQTAHRVRGTYHREVDAFIALSEFSRRTQVRGHAVPADRTYVVPNALAEDPGMGEDQGFALFVGRLVEEKGVLTLLRSWEALGPELPLKLVGQGPLAPEVERFSQKLAGVEWLGQQPHAEVLRLMKRARFLVFPSQWFEGMPMTLIEALAVGLPVLASRLGAMEEMIMPGKTGELFRPGDPEDLRAGVHRLMQRDAAELRRGARAEYLRRYTADAHTALLSKVYDAALTHRRGTPALQNR